MDTPNIDDDLRVALKAIVSEVFEEKADLIRQIVEDVIEDVAMSRAIEEGLASGPASEEEVFRILEG